MEFYKLFTCRRDFYYRTSPVISHDSPANATYFNYAPYFNGTCSDAGVGLDSIYTNLTEYSDYDTTSPYNFTNTSALIEGIYSVRISCNDSVNNTATSDFYFTFDLTNPTSTINAPGNDTWTNDNTPDINITMTDNFDSSITYNIYVNGSLNKTGSISNNTATNVTLDTQPEGLRLIIAEAIDDSGRAVNSSTIYLKIDSINPQIEFTTGTENNDTSKNQQWIFANVSITETNFQNITYKLYNSTGLLNETTYSTLITNINWTSLSNNSVQYWYNVTVYDDANNFNQTETRYITLTADNPPTITIVYPQNTTYTTNVTELNYTAEDDISLDKCWWSNNSGGWNSSPQTCGTNWTGLTSNEGNNTWTVYANDSVGQENSSSVTFTRDLTTPPTISSTSPSNTSSLAAGTTSTTIELTTNEIAVCRYNTTDVSWGNMTNLTNTNSTEHNFTVTGLSNGNTYNYYFLCEDLQTNRMNTSYHLQFGVSSPPPGGGGGGVIRTKSFFVNTDEIQVKLKQGETTIREIIIQNTGNQKLAISIENPKLQEFLKISETTFDLNPGELKTILLDFLVRENTIPNLYIGKLIIKGDGIEKEILIAIEVETKGALLDVKVEIVEEFLKVSPGQRIVADIKMFNLGISGRTDINVEYTIRDDEETQIFIQHETIAIETQTSFTKTIQIPEDIKLGRYVLYVKATYGIDGLVSTASASAWFNVRKESIVGNILVSILIALIISLIIAIIYILYKIRKINRERLKT
jgi:hypothetical protein